MKKLLCLLLLSGSTLLGRMSEEEWVRVKESDLRVGDLVFTRTGGPLFARVGAASGSWCSHVGVLVGKKDGEWVVAESKVPRVCETPLRRFLRRSEDGLFEIRRLPRSLSAQEQQALVDFARAEQGKYYDTGFNLASKRTFCSKFVRAALEVATGVRIGRVQTFAELLKENHQTPLWFWKIWYFGRVPWQRETVTPASQLNSPSLVTVLQSESLRKQESPDASAAGVPSTR